MDQTLLKMVIGSVLMGVGRISFLQTTNGQSFRNPEIVHRETEGTFGVIDSNEQNEIFIIRIDEVDIVY